MSRFTKKIPAVMAVFTLLSAAAILTPAAERASFALDAVENATSVLSQAIAYLGGPEKVDTLTAALDKAVHAGIPLTEAGLSDAQIREFAAQGSNVIVACDGPAGHPDIAKMNAMLIPAGGDAILCGGYNPDLDLPAVAASENAEGCSPIQGILAETLISVGGNDWSCGA
jgi:hypothetical protein